MPNISQITLPSGSVYDLKDKFRLHTVKGTQTESTYQWTGNIDVPELYDGLTIAYYLPYAGTSTSATLTLTTSNGNVTSPIAVYYTSTTRMTSHYGAGSTIILTFWSAGSISVSGTPTTNDRWTHSDYNSDTTTSNRISYFAGTTGAIGIWATSLFMEDGLGTYQNICTGSRTVATTKTANPNGFRIGGSIFYTNTTYNANSNISGSGVVYSAVSMFDARYSFNVTRASGQLTPYQPLYLKGTIHSDNLYYLDEVWWTQTPNETGKVYVLVGGVYDSTTSSIRITLYEQNDWYIYNGAELVAITCDAQTVSGHTVETDVPENAKFTDTTYAVYKTLASYVEPSENISTDDITSWSAGTVTTASVSGQTLVITTGTAPSLSYTSRSIPTYNITNKLVVNDVYELGPTETKKTVDFAPIISVDDAIAKNAVSTLLKFSPKQTGTGDPSPINIRPIVPWSETNLNGCGKNLLDFEAFSDFSNWKTDIATSGLAPTGDANRGFVLPLKQGTYTINFDYLQEFPAYLYLCAAENGVSTKRYYLTTDINVTVPQMFEVSDNETWYFRMGLTGSESAFNDQIAKIHNLQIELGSQATTYEPYTQGTDLTISLGGTYYGFVAYLENGTATINKLIFTFDGSENWGIAATGTNRIFRYNNAFKVNIVDAKKNSYISNIATRTTVINGMENSGLTKWNFRTTVSLTNNKDLLVGTPTSEVNMTLEEFKEMLGNTPMVIVADIETPQTIPLTPQTVALLAGNNTLWSNGDEVSLTYIATDSQ